jgi:hypothetical protein
MRLELIGKTAAKLVNVNVQAQKMGQTELIPATTLRFKVTAANDVLNKFDKTLRAFLFEKGSNAATQGTLDGVPPVSDLPQLTDAAKHIGDLDWNGEQTGCRLTVHQAVSKIVLKDCTVDKVKLCAHEGGAVDVLFNVYASDLNAETLGELAVLHQHELDIELELPAPLQVQKQVDEPQADADTPEKALARGTDTDAAGADPTGGWPFPTEDPAKKATVTTRKTRAGATTH